MKKDQKICCIIKDENINVQLNDLKIFIINKIYFNSFQNNTIAPISYDFETIPQQYYTPKYYVTKNAYKQLQEKGYL